MVTLLPHNEQAYEKLKKCLENNQMASINHATGTGKSFIILKYLYENRDKRILYIAPTHPILDQLTEEHMEELNIPRDEFKNFDTLTYAALLRLDVKSLSSKYDIIVLDEYHRCGARLWGKEINTLLDNVKKNFPQTKIIGTTATEIRYLDKERNMNDIIFNGVEASRLTLADAILEQILPAPMYISFNFSLLNDLYKIEENVAKYAFYENDKDKYLQELQLYKNELEKYLYNSKKLTDFISKCKKFLVFSSNINTIEKDRNFMNQLIPGKKNSFIVHSNNSKEENKKSLKEFRNISKENVSVLYSVDILNEGVHIKGADAIVLRRRTASPIIYFQQLGRILSYSRRKDYVVILDMVNNIKNHHVIYEIYQDVTKRAKELIKLHPENKERYRTILDRFKIVNETSQLSEKMDKLKIEYSKDNILEKRLYTAVKILSDPNYPNEIEKFQAQADLFKLENYITIELFNKIQELNDVKKPDILKLSEIEFKKLLGNYRHLKEKNSVSLKYIYRDLQYFYDKNHYLPSIFSDELEEKELAVTVMNNISNFSDNMKSFVHDYISDNLSLFEKINYGLKIDKFDEKKLIIETRKACSMAIPISHYVYHYLIGKIDNDELHSLITRNYSKSETDIILEDIKFEKKQKKEEDLSFIYKMEFEKVASKMLVEVKKVGLDKYIEDLFIQICEFMNKYQKDIEYKNYSNSILTKEEKELERELFCKKVILQNKLLQKGYLAKISDLSLIIKINNNNAKMEQLVEKLLIFINNNTGSLPSIKNKRNKDEVLLAQSYLKSYANMPIELKEKIFEAQNKFPNKKTEVLNNYISFIKTNNRKPMVANTNNEEVILNEELNRWMVYFTNEERQKLDEALKSISKYANIRNTYYALKNSKK